MVVVIFETIVGLIGVVTKASPDGLPPVDDLRFPPVDMTPIEDEQPSEEQSAQVREMRYMVCCQSCYRTETGEKLNECVYNNERTHAK